MTAAIRQFSNPWHTARVQEARRRVGLPVVFAQHPFAGLPCWERKEVGRG